MHIPGYQKLILKTRSKRGGGVDTFLQTGIIYKEILHEMFTDSIFEAQFILLEKFKTVIANVYKPPSCPIEAFLEKLSESINKLKQQLSSFKLIMGGDFNIDISKDSQQSKLFLDTLDTLELRHHIDSPTHFNRLHDTVIDNILTNTSEMEEVKVIQTSLSDHFGTSIKINIPASKKSKITYQRNLSSASILKLNLLLYNETSQGDPFDPTTSHPSHDSIFHDRFC